MFNETPHEASLGIEILLRNGIISQEPKPPKRSRALLVAGVMIVTLLILLAFPSEGYASTAQMQTANYATATYAIVTSTGSFYGNPGQLQCSPAGCTYIPGPYQYRVNPNTLGYYNGVYYAYVNDNYYRPCQPDLNHQVTCSGFAEQSPSGCTELVVVIANAYIPENYWYQYYTLHNLASNATINGQFVTVSGQMFTGPNSSPTSAACPGSYINVTSVS